jgi:hypothetical protein
METEKPRIGPNWLHGVLPFWEDIQCPVSIHADRNTALLQKTTHKLQKQLGKIIFKSTTIIQK